MADKRISKDDIRRLCEEIDLVQELKQAGRGDQSHPEKGCHKFRCIWHDERTPSLAVYHDASGVHCFGCGAHGNAIDVIQKLYDYDFLDAVRYLAKRTGFWPQGLDDTPLPDRPEPPKQEPVEYEPVKATWTPVRPVPEVALKAFTGRNRYQKRAPNHQWRYTDAEGRVEAIVCRYPVDQEDEADAKSARKTKAPKKYRPWAWCRSGEGDEAVEEWRERQLIDHRPLYRLAQLAKNPEHNVLVVEGEPAADAKVLQDLKGWIVTTWMGGHAAFTKTDLSPLKGRRVVFAPDFDWPDKRNPDGPGQTSFHKAARAALEIGAQAVSIITAESVARLLAGTPPDQPTPMREVQVKDTDRMATVPSLPHGWDFADAPDDWTTTDIRNLINQAERIRLPDHTVAASPATARGGDGGDELPPELPETDGQSDPRDVLRDCAEMSHTDQGNARRLVRRYGAMLRYSYHHGAWYVWRGTHWQVDREGLVNRLAMKCVSLIAEETHVDGIPYTAKEVIAHCESSQSRRRRLSMIDDAKDLDAITVIDQDLWDADPYLLATPSGTVDLRTGELHEARREDLVTRCTPVPYRPKAWQDPNAEGARCFRKVIQGVTGDDIKLREWLQIALGYSILGHNREEQFFVAYGPSRTGKTSLFQAAKHALGKDYGVTSQFSSFLATKKSDIRSDLARLAGQRMAFAEESTKGRRLDDELVKQVTGGSELVSRFLHENEFEYQAKFTLWLATNHRPIVDGSDDAVWERLRLVPFTRVVPPGDREKDLKHKLETIGREATLSWLVEGCIRYQREPSLLQQLPRVVAEATDAYRADMDPVSPWLDDLLWQDGLSATAKELKEAYHEWAEDKNIKPLSWNELSKALEDRGAIRQRTGSRRFYANVGLACNDTMTPMTAVSEDSPLTGDVYTHTRTRAPTSVSRDSNKKSRTGVTGVTPSQLPAEPPPPESPLDLDPEDLSDF